MTRKFSSYGPINISQHYYAPRQALIDAAYLQLVGENPTEGGHYITVWAPRQRGKTWLFQQAIQRIKDMGEFEVIFLSLQSMLDMTDSRDILHEVTRKLSFWLGRELPLLDEWRELSTLFSPTYLSKPLILILDEFDTLDEATITQFVSQLRNIYIERESELNVPRHEKRIWLHGLALIGVRASLGIDNKKGSPFNVQRGLHVPNLTLDELLGMLTWYEQESGQTFEAGVKERLFYEPRGSLVSSVGWGNC